jgi:potassium channel
VWAELRGDRESERPQFGIVCRAQMPPDDSEDDSSSEGDEDTLVKSTDAIQSMGEKAGAAASKYKTEKEEREIETKLLQHRGESLCEAGFLFGLRQEATLEAVSTAKCCMLQKSDFNHLMKQFPEILDHAQRSLLNRLRDSASPLLEEVERVQKKSEKQIAQLADLLFAAAGGELKIVQEAIEHGGVNVAEVDFEGRTALHIAASAGKLEVVEYLIQGRAPINRKDSFGKTPLSNAASKSYTAVVRALRDAGGDLGWTESETAGELCDRARLGHTLQLKLLLTCGAQVNSADYDGRTCLHSSPGTRLLVYRLRIWGGLSFIV